MLCKIECKSLHELRTYILSSNFPTYILKGSHSLLFTLLITKTKNVSSHITGKLETGTVAHPHSMVLPGELLYLHRLTLISLMKWNTLKMFL